MLNEKLYILPQKGVEIHWWGKDLYLFINRQTYIKTSRMESKIISAMRDNIIGRAAEILKRETHTSIAIARELIELFLKEYQEYFIEAEYSRGEFNISGEKGSYYPLELHVSLTNKCPQSCFHCYKEATKCGTDIDTKALIEFLEKTKGKVREIHLSGGEPSVHGNFREIIRALEGEYKINVLSSGIGIDIYYKDIHESNAVLAVTIFSNMPKLHDKLAGKEGSYSEIIQNIKSAKENGISVVVTTFIRNNNVSDILELIDSLECIGVKAINIARIAPLGRAKDYDVQSDFSIRQEDIDILKEKIKNLNNVNTIFEDEEENISLPNSIFSCSAGTLVWSINELGEVHPCGVSSVNGMEIGTIRDADLFSSKYRKMYIRKIKDFRGKNAGGCPFVGL
jgi:MoaA/NifB/PqqE/SkfB family radical SAM enzyme